MSRLLLPAVLLASLPGCATLTEPATQTIFVQAVEGHRPIANVGCLLANDAGRWYVNAPGRVTVSRRAWPLSVDCRKAGEAAGYEVVASRAGAGALWGNVVVSAGVGYIVDRNTGAGHDYPDTITIVMKRLVDAPVAEADPVAAAGTPIY
ncbi:hypothetical protein [Pseudoduganella sp. GCM10020061]|uniref:hypothetical protein n=1 Tax=Pseudoduganella sp. GCM10020061 TaxID=3317345 RepID=UPI00363097A5